MIMCSKITTQNFPPVPDQSITVSETHPLRSFALTHFLWNRRIPLIVAQQFCREAIYYVGEKAFYAVAFPNDAGGYTLLNRYHEITAGPQAPTLLTWGNPQLAVFNHFLDLLTLVAHLPAYTRLPDFLVLPDAGQTEYIPKHYAHLHLFLRNDPKGQLGAQIAARTTNRLIDHRALNRGYASLNDWACHIGQRPPDHPG
jgi:hypothetical protein